MSRRLEMVRAHPRHLVLFALVGGLLSGTWLPAAAPALAVVAAAVARRRTVALAAALAVAGGAAGAHVRAAEIVGGAPPAPVGAVVSLEVTLLERFRERASGERVAAARTSSGSRVLLRGRRRAGSPGGILEVRGTVEPLRPFEEIHRRRGTTAAIALAHVRDTGRRRGGPAGVLDEVRGRAERGVSAGLPDREAALLRGMVLGQDDAIARQVRADFETSGLAHILAVSGTNVMLLCVLAYGCCALLGIPLRPRLALALALTALYVPLTGASPSIQRAGIMGAAGIVATLASRAQSRWYALGLAAAVTLVLNPYASAEPGWQLSFAAVAGLIALSPRIGRVLRARGAPGAVAEVAAMTLAATVATAPLLAAHFGRVSLVSLPANLLAAPVVAPIMWLGMLSAGAGQASPQLALPLNALNAYLVAFLGWLAHVAASVPGAAAELELPGAGGVVAAYAVLFVCVAAGPRAVRAARPRAPQIAAVAVAAACLGVLIASGGTPEVRPGETLVSFLDVGQGDATLVRRDGAAVLFDTGPPDGPVVERLAREGVRRLDALVITHAQSDHEGAAIAVVERMRPRLIVNGGAGWPSPVQARLGIAAREVAARVHVPAAGEVLRLGRLEMRVLWPPAAVRDAPPVGDPNDRAVVAHVRSGDFDLLLPADAESNVTAGLALPVVEALKVAHHGSADEGLGDLVRRLRPAVATIEVGRGNRYGHPAPSTLAALKPVPRVMRTDRDGTVRLRTDGRAITVEREGAGR